MREEKDDGCRQSPADDGRERLLPDAESRRRRAAINQQHDRERRADIDAQEARTRELVLGDGLEDRSRNGEAHADEHGQDGPHHAEVKDCQPLLRRAAEEEDGEQMFLREVVEARLQVQEEEAEKKCREHEERGNKALVFHQPRTSFRLAR